MGGKEFLTELVMTFSKKQSTFSSIKIERFFSFSLVYVITVIYSFCAIFMTKTFNHIDLSVIAGIFLGYGMYNTYQVRQDKKLENGTINSGQDTETSSEN